MELSTLLPAFAFVFWDGSPLMRAGALKEVSATTHAPELMVIRGAEYYTAHLEDITADRALVLHRGGMTSAAWKDLSPSVQREYAAEHDAALSAQVRRAVVPQGANAVLANHQGANIALIDGTVYHDAVITSVDPGTATIRHPGGVTRVDLLDLPNDLRDKVAPHYNSDAASPV